jgi:beta-N-acetylhexosaminidase
MSEDTDLRRLALRTLLSSFPGPDVPSWVWRAADGGLGGVCLYGSNRGVDVTAVASGLHAVRADLVVAVDEEGGDVTRIEAATGSSVPGNAALGAVDDENLTRGVGRALGTVVRASGIDLDLAPCADVNSDPDNPVIGVRSFGADPTLVARHVAAFTAGLQEAGVAACAKHFPGHGATAVDSHVAVPTVTVAEAELRARELVPFRAAIAAGVRAVMPGHLLVPALDPDRPATASPRIVTDLLRGELGFAGLVVTDALDMGGAGGPDAIPTSVVAALVAGADLCCLGPDNDEELVEACVAAVLAAVDAGELPVAQLADAAARVAALRDGSAPSVPATGRVTDPSAGPAMASQERSHDRSPEHAPERGGADAARSALVAVGAEAARRALRVDGAVPGPLAGAHVVELDRPANIAAGAVPWGVARPLAALDPTATAARVPEGDDHAIASVLLAAADRPLVVVVRDAHRRPAQAAALATLAAARPDAVVVDMGWPADPAARPDVAAWVTTHGASRASGEVAAAVLARPLATASPAASGRTSRG